jgi:hypothetical protein
MFSFSTFYKMSMKNTEKLSIYFFVVLKDVIIHLERYYKVRDI